MQKFVSFSLIETQKIAKSLAKKLKPHKTKAQIIGLIGDLGSGKTTFVSGFLKAFGVKSSASPTFVLMRRKEINHKSFKNIYHIDFYRIKNKAELKSLKIEELFKNPQNILLIEWANKIYGFLPKSAIKIYFKHGQKENERQIILKNIYL